MNKRLILFFSFGAIFVFGFLAGTSWKSSEPLPVAPVEAAVPPTKTAELSEAETRISKALEDPDFKRVHDLLSRERPMQMNIPKKTETESPGERIPMESRPPVRFALENAEKSIP